METTFTRVRSAGGRGLLAIVAAALMWGTVGVAVRALNESDATNPLSIGFLRLAISVPALLLAAWALLGKRALHVDWRDLPLMALSGAMMALYQVCYFAAIERVGVAIAVLVTLCIAPVLVALFSALWLRERLGPVVVVALSCALLGTLLLVLGGSTATAQTDSAPAQSTLALVAPGQVLTGVLLALGSALGYAIIALCARTLAGRYHPLQPLTISFAIGALVLLPFALATGLALSYSPQGWALLLHLGLVPTALAYVLFLHGMRTTSATVASTVTLLEPLTGILLAWLLFDERFGPIGLLGGALLIAGILLVARAEGKR